MTTNEILTLSIALYGAVLSTFVLGWDAYKFLSSGAKVSITASTGMNRIGAVKPPVSWLPLDVRETSHPLDPGPMVPAL